MKKTILIVMVLVILSIGVSALTTITTCQELQDMDLDLNEDYILGNNIDCSGFDDDGDGKGFKPVSNGTVDFTGNFDGNKKVIDNLMINRAGVNTIGLIGSPLNAIIKDVGVINANMTGSFNVGILVGSNQGTINNTYTTGTVVGTGEAIGGLVGINFNGIILNSYSTANISGGTISGGLVGMAFVFFGDFDIINKSFATGNVTDVITAGGLIGENRFSFGGTFIINSYFNNHSGNPNECIGIDAGAGNCVTIQDNEAYFFDRTNEPMASWDFDNVWCPFTSNQLPILRGQSECKEPITEYEFIAKVNKNGVAIREYETIVKTNKVSWLIKMLDKIVRFLS